MSGGGCRMKLAPGAALVMMGWSLSVAGAEVARELPGIVYATVNGRALALDLHLPARVTHPPLVVYAHGGAWRTGSKSEYPRFLVERGYAVASVEFRASTDARFPANVHDIKAAIRFLRAHEMDYGYAAQRIAMAGASSGGHLAALVGTTSGVAELEGNVGDYPGESSAVQAIVSWYGASNLMTILGQSTAYGLSVREPALKLLLGDLPQNVPALARLASPVTHLDARDPPAILLHGDEDPQMPFAQMRELEVAYRKAGLAVEAIPVVGARHGGDAFYTGEPAERVIAFLRRTIGP
jgi:acetyl esterase/lipase